MTIIFHLKQLFPIDYMIFTVVLYDFGVQVVIPLACEGLIFKSAERVNKLMGEAKTSTGLNIFLIKLLKPGINMLMVSKLNLIITTMELYLLNLGSY